MSWHSGPHLWLHISSSVLLSGCASLGDGGYCRLEQTQVDFAIANLEQVQSNLEDDSVYFPDCWPLTSEGALMKSKGECWCKLSPESKDPAMGVFDGEVAVTFDVPSMRVLRVAEIVY